MLSWFIAAALILIFELFVGTIYLLVVSAALFGAGLAELLFGQTTISVLTAAVLAAVGIWWAKGWIRRHRRAPEIEAAAAICMSAKPCKSCAICTATNMKCFTAAHNGRPKPSVQAAPTMRNPPSSPAKTATSC